jgi:hypothetical protein
MSVLERVRGRPRDDDYEREPVAPSEQRERQYEEHGGTNWGAGFFGWLVAVGVAVLLTALVAAAGAALALSEFDTVAEAGSEAETISFAGAIALIVIGLIAYFAGGYVAGRMSRFDGGRQGVAVWIWSIVAVAVLAVLAVIAGEEYNVFAQLDLPRIPIDEGDLTTGGLITLVATVIGTLLAAIVGGKAGERYHWRVDRSGWRERRVREDDDARHPGSGPASGRPA